MSTRDAALPGRRSTPVRAVGSRRTKRSDFLRAYSPISFSQAFRVILLVAMGLGFIKMTHVAQARPEGVDWAPVALEDVEEGGRTRRAWDVWCEKADGTIVTIGSASAFVRGE